MATDGNDRRDKNRQTVANINRRKLLKYSTLAGTSTLSVLAGCTGGSGSSNNNSNSGGNKNGSNSSGGGSSAIDFGTNWKKRRTTSLDEWKLKDRQKIPSEKKLASLKAWKNSKSVQSSPWRPPEGWKDTAAGNIDTLQILNYGDLKYDPATLATYAMFEKRTGIKLKPLEIVVDQAIPKETAFLQAGQGKPQMFAMTTVGTLSSFAVANDVANLDALMPKNEMWNPYQPVTKPTSTWNNHVYASPAYLEGPIVHVRTDLLKEQKVPDASVKAILNGTWTWDDLETAMKAFKGTGTYAWAYHGGSRTYTLRDFKKMFYQAGGQLYKDGKVKVNTKAGYVALQKMVEWRKKGWVPNEVVSYGQGDVSDGFLSGQFAMVSVPGDLVPQALAKYKKNKQYQVTLTPKGGKSTPKPTRAGIAQPIGVSVNANAKEGEKLAGMVFMDALLSEPSQWWEFVVEGNQSFTKSVYKDAAKTGVAEFAKIRGKQAKLNKAEVYPQQRPIQQHISQECQKAIAGDLPPKKALDNAQDFIDTVLSQ